MYSMALRHDKNGFMDELGKCEVGIWYNKSKNGGLSKFKAFSSILKFSDEFNKFANKANEIVINKENLTQEDKNVILQSFAKVEQNSEEIFRLLDELVDEAGEHINLEQIE